MMRSVSFVERLELEFNGNLLQNSLVLGDVDNDGFNELVVGSVSGDLFIFKGRHTKAWAVSNGLGMVACIGIGDVFKSGNNSVIVLTSEGWCHVLNINKTPINEGKWDFSNYPLTLKPDFTQHLTANGKVLLIADIDGDGQCEVLVGHTDRIVLMYKWVPKQTETENNQTAKDVTQTKANVPGKEQKVRKLSKESDKDSRPSTPTLVEKELPSTINGSFQCVERWKLNGQIGSFALYHNTQEQQELLVSQPGGAYIVLKGSHSEGEKPNIEPTQGVPEPLHACYPLSTSHFRNPNVPTEIVGQVHRQVDQSQNLLAMCTLDGTLVLLENDQKLVWSLQVDHNLFSLAKLDINRDNNEEVVVCAWDGMTYIVDHKRNVVKYKFSESVSAFTAGRYGLEPKQNVPCLVYASFSNHIYIYWNVELTNLSPLSLIDKMADKIKEPEMSALLDKISDKDGKVDTTKLKQLNEWCLYGWGCKPW